MKTTAQHYIDKLELEPHPEGGYYRQLYGNDASGAPWLRLSLSRTLSLQTKTNFHGNILSMLH